MGTCFSDIEINKQMKNNFLGIRNPTKFASEDSSLKIKIRTWHSDILPDLRKQNNSTLRQIVLTESGCISYNENQNEITLSVKETTSQQKNQSTEEHRMQKLSMAIEKEANGYKLTFLNDFIFELVTTRKQISPGDRLLFGGTEYKYVKFIRGSTYDNRKIQPQANNKLASLVKTQQYMQSYGHIQSTQQNQKPTCRICFQAQSTKQNPLVCPCSCIGSVKYFHLKCWSSWIFSSEVSNQNLYIGNVIKQKCDLCKKNLLEDQLYREQVAALLSSVAKIKPPFIVLEGLRPLQNYPYYRGVKLNYIILSFAQKKKYLIGRGGSVDIPLVIDISISRSNSVLFMRDNRIYIHDAGSKHGTYIRTQKPIMVKNDVPKYFLYKNHLVSAAIN